METINITTPGRYAVIKVATGVTVTFETFAEASFEARNHGSTSIVVDLESGRVCDVFDGGYGHVSIGINGIQHQELD